MRTSGAGVELIKRYEVCKLSAYRCAAGVWTIGYGHTAGVKQGDVIIQAQADAFFTSDLIKFENKVAGYDSIYHWTQNEFDALVSFAFNVGSITQLTNGGKRSKAEIAEKIPAYCKADGKVLSGLVRRREEEKALFLGNRAVAEKKSVNGAVKRVNVHAGHNPDGLPAHGAVGFLSESTEARKIKDKLIALLRAKGYTVYDCTVDDGKDQADILKKIVQKCNAHYVDIDISIHLNAGAKDQTGNGKTTGAECLVYSAESKSVPVARSICQKICGIGFNYRGVKERKDLFYLKHTKAPAVLVEVCFVDDKDDFLMYDADGVAEAIADSI